MYSNSRSNNNRSSLYSLLSNLLKGHTNWSGWTPYGHGPRSECVPALVCLTLVEQISRCVLHPPVGHTNAILGSCSRAIHAPQQPAGLPAREVCLCVCVCVFLGSSLGRGRAVIACSSPGAGYGHPGHVSCIGAKLHCGSVCFQSSSTYFAISSNLYRPPF